MKAMYNNYEQDTAINEYVSPIERKEEDEFIDAVLATPVMRLVLVLLWGDHERIGSLNSSYKIYGIVEVVRIQKIIS